MRNRMVKNYISCAISNSVPDVLDIILKKCELKRGFKKMKSVKNEEIERKNSFFLTPKLIGGVCAAVILFGVIVVGGVNQYNKKFGVESIIEFDVNPSIELKLNKDEDIIETIALNNDAKKVLKDMDLEGVDLDVAVNAIIGSMMKNGYLTIDQNSILVSVKNDDKKESERLQKKVSEEINELLIASSVNGSVLSQEFEIDDYIEKKAKEYGISEGKTILIKKILDSDIKNTKGERYTYETLAGLTITELNLLLNEKDSKGEIIKSPGTASESGYIGKEKAKSIAFNDAGIKESKASELEIELDADDGILLYEVEFDVGNKNYEYDINAKTGKIIDKDIDYDDDDKYDNDDDDDKYDNDDDDKYDNDDDDKYDNDDDDDKYDNDDDDKVSNNVSTSYIGKEKAKSIAFNNAGVSSSSVRDLEIEFDEDDGVYLYEIDFKVNNKEYSYEINAVSGKILDKDIEIDD